MSVMNRVLDEALNKSQVKFEKAFKELSEQNEKIIDSFNEIVDQYELLEATLKELIKRVDEIKK